MTDLIYNLTREQAAEKLSMSTRTIDRNIRRGVFSYKKIANKVFLSQQEIEKYIELQSNSGVHYGELVWNSTNFVENNDSTWLTKQISESISANFDNFMKILKEKDTNIEEKNNFIFVLQHRIGELESKLKNTIALPDYTNEKNQIILEKQRLEIENDEISNRLKRERIKNIVYLIILFALVSMLIGFLTTAYN